MNKQSVSEAVSRQQGMTPAGDNGLTYQNLKLTYEVSATSLLLVAHQGASAHLLIAPETDYTRSADSLGVSDESKIGSADFDSKFVIRDVSGQAKEMLSAEVIAFVEALEPFVELELCNDMIRLLKKPTDEASALRDLETLASLAHSVSAVGKV